MTREEIEQLDDTEPYSFETDREELWYKIGLKEGLETADQHPRKGLWDAEKVTNWLRENFEHYAYNYGVDEVIVGLAKAMEEIR
jgi:hypothetical protein